MTITRTLAASLPAAMLVGLLATPALAGPAVGGIDVPATFGLSRVSASEVLVSTTVKAPRPSAITSRVMLQRDGKTLANLPIRGTQVRVSLKGVKPGDYVTVTATDGRNTDREARRIVVGPMR